ncbi:uncharacterized protein LOC106454087 [Brassica napus]|uniref:uncharacterized protein LOC106454087 n=1 Tax=Brassica napus TaxID=3708 RepID=UPI0020784F5E|nr:uncharacterized protein LOC106454087 [Brassica napus]
MAYEFPQRILEEGIETQIDKINNTCRRTILEEVKVFSTLKNKLIYSGKIIHSFICKQLKVSKLHELWFLFAKRPLRFSAQEFHAVTGLKFKDEPDINFNDWKDDKGFWSNVLRKNRKVNLSMIKTKLLNECNKWTYVDRVRLVYLCVIHGFLIAKDSRVFIPHEYIRLVMDFEKMRMYPWGLHAYDELLASILKARKDLHLKNSYVLDGFSYAFQIWVMEAIPDIGSMVGKKIKKNMTKGELFPFISATGNNDVVDSTEFYREDEKIDERIGRIVTLLNAKQDWTDFVWEVEALPPTLELSDSETDGENVEVEDVTDTHVDEPAVVARRGKRKLNDPGAEARKKELLCQRAAEHNSGISSGMKTFIEGLFTSAFNSFKDVVQNDIQERFEKVQKEMAELKQAVSQIPGPSATMGKDRASEIPCPSATMGKSSQSPCLAGTKEKGKGKVDESVVPPTVRRSPRQGRKEIETETDDMMDFLKNLSQSSTHGEPSSIKEEMSTQEYLQDAMGNLSQVSHVKGFDPSQKTSDEEAPKWVTPVSSFKPVDWRTPTLKDMELPDDRVNDDDYSLVFVHEDSWAKLIHWCSTTKQHLKIGPSMYTTELAERVMGPAVWLQNQEIDAVLFLFRERTSLRRWKPSKVAFMSCIFSNQMKNSYTEFKKDKKKFRVEGLLHQYGIGELLSHGRTRLMWDLDVNRMYVPLLVHGNHWISMCVNFVTRSIEVFDCAGLKHNKDLEPFAHLIPRIVKAVQSSEKRGFTVKPYDVTYAPMPCFLNKTSSDCGVYALKHIEAHLLGMDLTLVNDDNIREARQKIAYDLWEAANDPELISRMGKYVPPKAIASPTVEIL